MTAKNEGKCSPSNTDEAEGFITFACKFIETGVFIKLDLLFLFWLDCQSFFFSSFSFPSLSFSKMNPSWLAQVDGGRLLQPRWGCLDAESILSTFSSFLSLFFSTRWDEELRLAEWPSATTSSRAPITTAPCYFHTRHAICFFFPSWTNHFFTGSWSSVWNFLKQISIQRGNSQVSHPYTVLFRSPWSLQKTQSFLPLPSSRTGKWCPIRRSECLCWTLDFVAFGETRLKPDTGAGKGESSRNLFASGPISSNLVMSLRARCSLKVLWSILSSTMPL